MHKVAINLSARQFQSSDLVQTVRTVLAETACRPEWIELEITESLLLDEHGEVSAVLQAFRQMGITIAIDDFGTGYSALSYLARFPINTLKIDRSFTSRVTEGGHHAELVKAIISIASSLNQQVVAEGVETAAEAAFLQTHGCHVAQGYLYSKPIPKSEFELLAERSQVAAQEISELAGGSVEKAESAGQLLDAIVPAIGKTSGLVQEIAAASTGQSSGVGQINTAMTQLNQITQQNASSSEELAATAEEMSGQAAQLQEVMSFFKVDAAMHTL